ncbi:hypothetical protein POM88_014995 [Heracleum sosnowskyi]|uniref:Plastocyanin-like domain-containing protein n=1 Tax=Heracleum sosnowskyi TaxID=360622 RepID=A0AAD8ILZ1_9APIA|nr:hypothetical protein POM88_014995 [Heracleum sosnowskyi]
MGTTAHCESYTPGYYSRDMNEDSNSSSWSPFHRDKNLLTGHYYNGFVQRTVRDECAGYEKDVLKQKMMEHEMVFKNQVYELHRLYRVQREMMEEAKRKELYNHHRSVEASSSSSIVPSQMSSDEVRNWHSSSFPLASPSCIRSSILGSEVIDSPLSCIKVHNSQASLVPYQNSCDLKERALDSRPSKARKKLFDLQIPAEKYIVIEDEEQFQDTEMSNTLTNPTNGNHRLAPGNSIKKYMGGGTISGLKNTSSGEEIRGLGFPAKPKSQFIDLSRDTLQNSQCGSSNGNYSTLSEANKGSGRGWLSYMHDAGNIFYSFCLPFPLKQSILPLMSHSNRLCLLLLFPADPSSLQEKNLEEGCTNFEHICKFNRVRSFGNEGNHGIVDLPLRYDNGIWEQGTEVWVGVKPPIDVDVFGRSDSDEAESKMHVMDLFLWERWLTEDEIAALPSSIGSVDYNMIDLPQDIWKWADSPSRVDEWDSDPTDVYECKTYRLRVSNVGISTSLNFRIQGHNLLLAETEGPYTVQQNYTSLDIHVGQTYSFFLSTDQNASTDYYIVESARFVNESVWRRVTGVGILCYSNSKGKASGPLPEAPQDQFDKTFSMNQARSIRWNVSASDARPNPQGSF